MQRFPVNSTFAKSIGYDFVHSILEIETHPSRNQPGHIYQYRDVPINVFAKFVKAHSIGSYYNRYILHHYDSVEVWEEHINDIHVSLELTDHLAGKLANKFLDNLLRKLSINFNPEA